MNIVARTAISAFIASVVPAVPFIAISLLGNGNDWSIAVALIAWAIGATHIVALGIPTFALLSHKRVANRWTLMLAGFVLGFVPMAIFTIQGAGLDLYGPFVFGVIGAFSAWVFWVVWGSLGPNYSIQRTAGAGLE
jgi:hypothetical protein